LKFKLFLLLFLFSSLYSDNSLSTISTKLISFKLTEINSILKEEIIIDSVVKTDKTILTPFQFYLSRQSSDFGYEVNKNYIEFLLNNKGVENVEEIDRVLNSSNGTLNYYEALLKIVYIYYVEYKVDKEFNFLINKVYSRGYEKLENVHEGFLIQDIILSLNKTEMNYNHLITEFDYCDITFHKNKVFKIGCEANQIALMCLNEKSTYVDYLSLISLENYELAKYIHAFCKVKKVIK